MPALYVECDPGGVQTFHNDPRDLLALISFGAAEPFGSQHPLTELVRRLRNQHLVDVRPLLTFYDRDVEDDVDAVNLEAAWQPAKRLGQCVRAVRAAIAADDQAPALLTEYPAVPELLAELEALATDAGAARIRISFSLH